MKAGDNIGLIWPGKAAAEPAAKAAGQKNRDIVYPWVVNEKTLFAPEITAREARPVPRSRCYWGDNFQFMQQLIDEGYEGALDLIYIDPPYMSSANYHAKTVIESKNNKQIISRLAFSDVWNYDSDSYLSHIYPRLQMMRRLLKANGSIFVHLDWHISHYIKVLLDEIFSPAAFINEIVWCYSGGSGAIRHFQRKHDVILWYAKGPEYIFHPQYRPYSQGTLQRGLTRVKGDKYRLNDKGANLQDWWADINKILSPTARENLKFPTQKPLDLIKRIIAAASDPGSLVADFYAGSGTTAAVCAELERQWICCDSSPLAVNTMVGRLLSSQSQAFILETDNDYITPGNARVKIEAVKTRTFNNKTDLSINIKDFTPRQENLNPGSPAAFIHFWEVDLNHNGRNFCSDVQILRKSSKFDDSLCLDIMVRIPAREQLTIAVRIHDLWGNITTRIIELGN